MSRAPKQPQYPSDLWDLMHWAKHRGVLFSLETNTSLHGGTGIRIWIKEAPSYCYYDQWTEKTQLGMRPDDFARWARKVESLVKDFHEKGVGNNAGICSGTDFHSDPGSFPNG